VRAGDAWCRWATRTQRAVGFCGAALWRLAGARGGVGDPAQRSARTAQIGVRVTEACESSWVRATGDSAARNGGATMRSVGGMARARESWPGELALLPLPLFPCEGNHISSPTSITIASSLTSPSLSSSQEAGGYGPNGRGQHLGPALRDPPAAVPH
jgi:hypothetical protein